MVTAPLRGSRDLLDRAGDLKGELVEFARRPRFSGEFRREVRKRFGRIVIADDGELIDFMDWFVLQHRLRDGRPIVEHFAAARRDLPDAERQMLLGWTEVVEGVFEVGRRDGPALLLFNLVDDMTYRARANVGPQVFGAMPPGGYTVARLVPVEDEWMLSGATHVLPGSERRAVLRMAAELSFKHPDLVFRNPQKLAEGWEAQRWDRERFVEFFGADVVVLERADLAGRMDAYWRWRFLQTRSGEVPVGSRGEVLPVELPAALLEAETVGLIYDEVEGLAFLPEFGLVQEVFAEPRHLADCEHRQAIVEYLGSDSITPLAFRRLAALHGENASEVFRRLLKKPGFRWERDGEALMRRRKPWFFARKQLPRVTPATAAMLEIAEQPGRWWRSPQGAGRECHQPAIV